jgi:signal transduction histidine kinase
MRTSLAKIRLDTEKHIEIAWRSARDISSSLGLDEFAQTRIATAVSSVARESFRSAAGAMVEFAIERSSVSALVVLIDPYRGDVDTQEGCRLMDRCKIEDGATAILRMEKWLPADFSAGDRIVERVASALKGEQSENPLDQTASRDQDSLRLLKQLDQAREEIAQLNQELEDTNRGVTALYTELDERTQQLRRASELKSRFLSHLSHEVRTPVNSILALCGILLRRLDGELTPEQDKQVTYIRESADQLSRLVADELDLAKVEAGKISLHVSTFRIEEVFGALRGMFKPLSLNPAVNMIFEEPSGVPELHTDDGKVAQILRNLISNALKFTPAGEIRIRAIFDSVANAVEFTVADTGLGIAPIDQERIFQEFYQAPSEARARGEGAGIGLHLSRQLASLLGGSLTVESQLHIGTVFTATIPVVCPLSEMAAGHADLAAPHTKPPILVIDDDRLSRYLVKQNIGDMDWPIVEAESGAEGLSLARKEIPGLIFLDLVMPEINGFDVLRELRAEARTREIPIVILTSKSLSDGEKLQLKTQVMAIVDKADVSRELLRGMVDTMKLETATGRTVH